LEVNLPDEPAVGDRDQRLVERPVRRAPVDVGRRLRGDAVAFLRDGGEEERERTAIALLGSSNPDRVGCRGAQPASS
jgi:hypothetical protein